MPKAKPKVPKKDGQQNKVIEAGDSKKFQEKINKLLKMFWEKVNDPAEEIKNLYKLREDKLSFLKIIYWDLRAVLDAYQKSHNLKEYRGRYKTLLGGEFKTLATNLRESLQTINKSSKQFFLDLPEDLLNSIFSYLLSPAWTPTKDPRDILLLFEVLLIYYEYLEELCPTLIGPSTIAYQMDIATMRLIFEAITEARKLDKKGRIFERTYKSGMPIKEKGDQLERRIIGIWDNLKNEKGLSSVNHMTRNRIATLIVKRFQKTQLSKVSTNTVIKYLGKHFRDSNEPPPWRPIMKKVHQNVTF
jgi:hypothetical protein